MALPTRSAASLTDFLTSYSENYLNSTPLNQAWQNTPLLDYLLSDAKDAEVTVRAEKNVDGTTLEYEYKDLQSPDDKLQLIYPGSQYFEIKGVRNGTVYFIKKILKGDVFYTLEIEYPEAKKEEYGEVMNGIADSFEVNPG